jgi:hypothetical protein
VSKGGFDLLSRVNQKKFSPAAHLWILAFAGRTVLGVCKGFRQIVANQIYFWGVGGIPQAPSGYFLDAKMA